MNRGANGQNQSVPVGTVTIRTHKKDTPRAWVKIGEPNVWATRALKVWLDAGGPKPPEGFILHRIDGDSLNDQVNNLALIPQGGHPQFHKEKLRERQTGKVYPLKNLRCTRCQKEFQGKHRKPDVLCPDCRSDDKKKLRKRRYQLTGG